ncbi:MAG TPA: hypothetical protein VF169_11530 [Albitalea sp.]|uniref:hypothetical protein n=1 Tax=Piscinibacter sp. TaxID=1903157 RepID=UPI002ED381EE
MRASPAFQIDIQRYGAWRAVVGVLLLLAAASALAWALADDGTRPRPIVLAGGALATTLICAGTGLMRMRAVRLRWDSQRWLLGAPQGSPGNLGIALDLGSWMLLKFEHDLMPPGRRVSWLPVQRRGLEAHWHALRCAVYCARSAPGHDAGPNSARPAESQE